MFKQIGVSEVDLKMGNLHTGVLFPFLPAFFPESTLTLESTCGLTAAEPPGEPYSEDAQAPLQ